jgi:hypothetical protein
MMPRGRTIMRRSRDDSSPRSSQAKGQAAGPVTGSPRLYGLAAESAPAGARPHAAGDQGVTFRRIAKTTGRHLDGPARTISPAQAEAHLGFLSVLAAPDNPHLEHAPAGEGPQSASMPYRCCPAVRGATGLARPCAVTVGPRSRQAPPAQGQRWRE